MTNFEWQIEDETRPKTAPPAPPDKRPLRRLWAAIPLLVLVIGVGSWLAYRVQQADRALLAQLQQLLDLERDAWRKGDDELFFSLFTDDDNWRAAQLLPENLAVMMAEATVDAVAWHEDGVTADVSWEQAGARYTRRAFFEPVGVEAYRHAGTSERYWGETHTRLVAWGIITLSDRDLPWFDVIVADVAAALASACGDACPELTLVVAPDFGTSPAPHIVRVPSPHLVGLDADGQPAPFYVALLQRAVTHKAVPNVPVAFAVPANQQKRFEALAEEYEALFPGRQVDIVVLPESGDAQDTFLGSVDAALVTPSKRQLFAGRFADLSYFVYMDAGFAAADYYDQHWQAGVWRDRVWMVPYAAEMRVLYYDALAYRRAGLTVPSSRWTWTEMLADVNTLSQRPPDDGIRFGVMSKTPDLLYAHAYSHGTGTLDSAQIRSTQAWYDELESQAGHAVPLQRESAERRDYLFRNFLNYPVRVAIWIDTPALYEHYLQYNPLGVAPFPATERFEAVTPLWVSGFAMLQSAENPTATWQWIKFASHFAPQPNLRLIPARPSTAAESGYWTTLPRQLADVMRPAFPSARAIAIDERDAFTWPD